MNYDTNQIVLDTFKENANNLGLSLTEYFLYLLVLRFY